MGSTELLILLLGAIFGLAIYFDWPRDTAIGVSISIAVFLSFFVYWGVDQYWPPWCFIIMLSVIYFSWSVKCQTRTFSRFTLSGIALFTWVCLNGLALVEFKPALEAPGHEIGQILTVKNLSSTALLEFLVLFLVFTIGWKKLRLPLTQGFYWVGLVHVLSLIWDQVFAGLKTGEAVIGLLGNRSIGASFAAVWIFAILHFKKELLPCWPKNWGKRAIDASAVLGVIAVLVSSSGISYLALLIGIGTLAVRLHKKAWMAVLALLAIGVALGGFIKPEFWHFEKQSRFEAWPIFFNFWYKHFPLWFGSGLGTFKFWGPVVQSEEHFREGKWWPWCHNDWLQIYLELGFIGLGCAVWFFADLLDLAKKRRALFAALVAFGVVMAANYGLHQANFALFAWLLVFETLEGRDG